MTTTTTKLTAGNCPALARIKAAMNDKIYRECLNLANEQGLDAVRAYLRTFFRTEFSVSADRIMDGTD